jgi:hypothetical protein
VKTRRFSEVQVLRILQEADGGEPVVIVTWEHEVSPVTIYAVPGMAL